MVGTDTIKAIATYAIALVIVIGGFITLLVTRNEPTASEIRLAVVTLMGSATTFVFTRETQTQTSHQVAAATLAAVNTTTNGHDT